MHRQLLNQSRTHSSAKKSSASKPHQQNKLHSIQASQQTQDPIQQICLLRIPPYLRESTKSGHYKGTISPSTGRWILRSYGSIGKVILMNWGLWTIRSSCQLLLNVNTVSIFAANSVCGSLLTRCRSCFGPRNWKDSSTETKCSRTARGPKGCHWPTRLVLQALRCLANLESASRFSFACFESCLDRWNVHAVIKLTSKAWLCAHQLAGLPFRNLCIKIDPPLAIRSCPDFPLMLLGSSSISPQSLPQD